MKDKEKTRNSEVLASFVKYCEEHPQERFWQALRNWVPREAGWHYVFLSNQSDSFWKGRARLQGYEDAKLRDTWSWERIDG